MSEMSNTVCRTCGERIRFVPGVGVVAGRWEHIDSQPRHPASPSQCICPPGMMISSCSVHRAEDTTISFNSTAWEAVEITPAAGYKLVADAHEREIVRLRMEVERLSAIAEAARKLLQAHDDVTLSTLPRTIDVLRAALAARGAR